MTDTSREAFEMWHSQRAAEIISNGKTIAQEMIADGCADSGPTHSTAMLKSLEQADGTGWDAWQTSRKALEAEQAQEVELETRHIHENAARLLIDYFLCAELGIKDAPSVTIEKQGKTENERHSWAFWVLENDTTSYLQEDGRIQWYGTEWEPEAAKPQIGEVPAKLKALLSAPPKITTGPCGQCKSSADPCYCGNVNTGERAKLTPAQQVAVPANEREPLNNDEIKALMLANGFSIKEGLSDLKPYVYLAARAIEAKVQQVAVNQGCQYPMCHSEGYQQAVTAQITAELWTGVVVPPGYVLVPIEPTIAMMEAGSIATDYDYSQERVRKVWQQMAYAAPEGDET